MILMFIQDIVSGLAMKSKVLEAQNWADVEVKAGAVIKRCLCP